MNRKYANLQERILANTVMVDGELDTPCWVWTGKRCGTNKSYGGINLRITRGPNKGKVRTYAVHRIAIWAFTGRRPIRHSVTRHKCHNSLCCNPAHLIANSTQKKNMQDMMKAGRGKGQFTRKEEHDTSKPVPRDVQER